MIFAIAFLLLWTQTAPRSPQKAKPAVSAELSIQAGVLLRNGELRRVARTPLILLNADVDAKLHEIDRRWRGSHPMYEANKRLVARGGTNDVVAQMDEFIKAHTVATATTDFDGKATIQAPPGDYFIYGVFELGDQVAVWSLPVTLKPGKNEIILDHNNTAR